MVSKRLHRLLSTVALLGVCFCLGPYTSAAGDPFLGYDGPVLPNPAIPTPWMQTWGTHAADFNEDGLMDVAIVGETGVLILLGNGDCTFSSDFTFFAGFFASAVADFNEDNHQDIVMTDGGNGAGIDWAGERYLGTPALVNVTWLEKDAVAAEIARRVQPADIALIHNRRARNVLPRWAYSGLQRVKNSLFR